MTYLWQLERGKEFYFVQTDDRLIAKKLKRRNKFYLSAIALNDNLWVFKCEFTRPDIAKKVMKSVTGKNAKIDDEGMIYYE